MIGMIQGPPGTGKTHMIIEMIRNLKFEHFPELITSDDCKLYNIIVKSNENDSLLLTSDFCECLDKKLQKIKIKKSSDSNGVKIGDKYYKIGPVDSLHRTILICTPSNCSVDELISRVIKSQMFPKNYILRYGTYSENCSTIVKPYHYEKICEEIEENENNILIGEKTTSIRPSSNTIFTPKEKKLQIIKQAKIIFTTLNSSGSKKIKSLVKNIKCLIIDEACQATEVQTLVPLGLEIDRVILVGDPKQLPATTFIYNADKLRLNVSLFERLEQMGIYTHLLRIQYRMVPQISEFISKEVYDSRLIDAKKIEVMARAEFCFYQHAVKNILFGGKERWSKDCLFDTVQYNKIHSKQSGEFLTNKEFEKKYINFLNVIFCENKNLIDKDYSKLLLEYKQKLNGLFFIESSGSAIKRNNSFSNFSECLQIKKFVTMLENFGVSNIGIISPYKNQTKQLRKIFKKSAFFERAKEMKNLEINTIDGFQGRQKDIIIISCVKNTSRGKNKITSMGFLKDIRRANVAISRAKFGVFVFGNLDIVSNSSSFWKNFIHHVKQNKKVFKLSTTDIYNQIVFDQHLKAIQMQNKVNLFSKYKQIVKNITKEKSKKKVFDEPSFMSKETKSQNASLTKKENKLTIQEFDRKMRGYLKNYMNSKIDLLDNFNIELNLAKMNSLYLTKHKLKRVKK